MLAKLKKLIKTDDNNTIIVSTTNDNSYCKDPENWIEVGETTDRNWKLDITDENMCYKYKYIDGEVVKRTDEDRKDEYIANMTTLIKHEANRIIIAKYPEWKQRNMIAEFSTILDNGESTARKQELLDVWSWIGSIRSQSDAMEAQLQLLSAEEIKNYTIEYNE